MKGPFEIRNAVEADSESLSVLQISSWRHAYRGLMPAAYLEELSVQHRNERWIEILKRKNPLEQTLVAVKPVTVKPVAVKSEVKAEDHEHLLGFSSTGPARDETDQTGELYAIYLAPHVIGCGLGSALAKTSLAHLRACGFKRAVVWVLEGNLRARRFYEQHGWKLTSENKIVDFGDATLNELRYLLSL